jgi:hypothetical protein
MHWCVSGWFIPLLHGFLRLRISERFTTCPPSTLGVSQLDLSITILLPADDDMDTIATLLPADDDMDT